MLAICVIIVLNGSFCCGYGFRDGFSEGHGGYSIDIQGTGVGEELTHNIGTTETESRTSDRGSRARNTVYMLGTEIERN